MSTGWTLLVTVLTVKSKRVVRACFNLCKGAVIIYGRGWGGANLKIACTKNLPPSELASYVFAPPRILRTKILPPPYASVSIHLHVYLLEAILVLSVLHVMTK